LLFQTLSPSLTLGADGDFGFAMKRDCSLVRREYLSSSRVYGLDPFFTNSGYTPISVVAVSIFPVWV